MNPSSTEILSLLAPQGRHIVRERRGSRFNRDVLVIKAADGDDLEVELGGYAYHPVEIPAAVFADFESAHLVHADGRDAHGDEIYRLRETAMSRAAA